MTHNPISTVRRAVLVPLGAAGLAIALVCVAVVAAAAAVVGVVALSARRAANGAVRELAVKRAARAVPAAADQVRVSGARIPST